MFFWLAWAASLTACIVSFAYVLSGQRRKAKKPLRIVNGFAALYLAGIFWMAATGAGDEVYLLRTGILTSIGVFVASLLIAAEAIADWRVK